MSSLCQGPELRYYHTHVINIYIPAKNDISSWLNKYWVTPSWEMLSPFFLLRAKTGLNRSDFQKQKRDCESICGPQKLQTSIKASRLSSLSEKPRQWPCFRCEHYPLWHIQSLCASHQWAGREQKLVHGELVHGYMSYFFQGWCVRDRFEPWNNERVMLARKVI